MKKSKYSCKENILLQSFMHYSGSMHLVSNAIAMKTELYLQIPKPCHENWDAMTTVDRGKFCASCSKEVVDFSLLSDVEVLNFFKKSKGNTCGRFNVEQLERPLQETKIETKKGWKWAVAGITSLIMISKSNAQTKGKCSVLVGKIKIEQPKKQPDNKKSPVSPLPVKQAAKTSLSLKPPMLRVGVVAQIVPDRDVKIKGVVVDEKNNTIPGAMVRTSNNTARVFTDLNGYFEMPANIKDEMLSVAFSAFSFIDENAVVDLTKDQSVLRIVMKSKVSVLPEVTVISYTARKRCGLTGDVAIYQAVTKKDTIAAFIRKVLDTPSPFKILANPLTIYPNPATKNSIIHLSIKEIGNYQVQVFDNASRLLQAEENTTTVKKETINLQLPANITSGIYYLRLINMGTKKSYTDKLIIQ